MVVEKRVLMKVVFPKPDSPATCGQVLANASNELDDAHEEHQEVRTMIVKAAPRLATILCRWLGRLAMPIGEALSAVAGAILSGRIDRFDGRRNVAARALSKRRVKCVLA